MVPCRAGLFCAPAPGRLFAARQRKFCQRRLAASPAFFAPQAESPPGPSGFNRPFLRSRVGSSVTLHPYCAPALNYRLWLTGALSFTIPPAWRCHAVPPLHKGGFSLPWPVVLTWAKRVWPSRHGTTLPGLHPGPFRVMVYHTRSSEAPGASPPETGTTAGTPRRRHAACDFFIDF